LSLKLHQLLYLHQWVLVQLLQFAVVASSDVAVSGNTIAISNISVIVMASSVIPHGVGGAGMKLEEIGIFSVGAGVGDVLGALLGLSLGDLLGKIGKKEDRDSIRILDGNSHGKELGCSLGNPEG
jgi:hypothetical protein